MNSSLAEPQNAREASLIQTNRGTCRPNVPRRRPSGTRRNSAWHPSIVLPNFQPPIALNRCFVPAPSWRDAAAKAGRAVPARRDRAGDHTLPLPEALDRRAQPFDHPHRLIADREALGDRILALEDVDVGAADCGDGTAPARPAPGIGDRFLCEADAAGFQEDGGLISAWPMLRFLARGGECRRRPGATLILINPPGFR